MLNRDNYNRVTEAFAKKRSDARDASDARLYEVYSLDSRIKNIDDQLALTGVRIFEQTVRGKENLDARLDQIRKESESLRLERKELLEKLSLPEDYTDIHYECPVCRDSGSVEFSMCSCFKRALIEEGYKSSGIARLMKTQSFESFDLSYFEGDAKRQAMTNLQKCRNYAENFGTDDCKHLILRGNTGLGKTHLSTSIAKVVVEKGYDVVYESAQNIFNAFENERFRHDASANTARFFECDLLICDDLGTEMSTQFTVSALYNLINTRVNSERATIINTNLSFAELQSRYTDRIFSRMLCEFSIIEFLGKDIRLQKLTR